MTIWIVRHGFAGRKGEHPGDDAERPLDHDGVEQAAALAEALLPDSPTMLCASPTRRCRQTLEPLSGLTGLAVHDLRALAAGGNPSKLAKLLRDLPRGAVLCTHGEVMEPLLDLLRAGGVTVQGATSDDELLRKGSLWRLDRRAATLTWWAPDGAGAVGRPVSQTSSGPA